MSAPKPIGGYPSMIAAVTDLTSKGFTPADIAARLHLPEPAVRAHLYKRQNTARKSRRHIQVPATVSDILHRAAYVRGISTLRLITRLLETIAADNMLDAILDDEDEVRKRNPIETEEDA